METFLFNLWLVAVAFGVIIKIQDRDLWCFIESKLEKNKESLLFFEKLTKEAKVFVSYDEVIFILKEKSFSFNGESKELYELTDSQNIFKKHDYTKCNYLNSQHLIRHCDKIISDYRPELESEKRESLEKDKTKLLLSLKLKQE